MILKRYGETVSRGMITETPMGRILSLDVSTKEIVVRFPGYTYNPGSRYSGLKDYQSPVIEIFRIKEIKDNRLIVDSIVSFENKKEKPYTKEIEDKLAKIKRNLENKV